MIRASASLSPAVCVWLCLSLSPLGAPPVVSAEPAFLEPGTPIDSMDQAVLKPGAPVDYAELAFEPSRWKEGGIDTEMVPWEGKHIVFLTTKAPLEAATVARFVGRMDAGWELYANLTGRSPSPHKELRGKPVIAAVPDAGLTCGYGCGFVGLTGIELAGFYADDYPLVAKSPGAYPHYVFYEMGRNFYTFGDRHSAFVTGFAVFMRYVCMDALGCEDPDRGTRETIEKAEAFHAKDPELTFLRAFTTFDGYDEKRDRIRGLSPTDQPVMYASAMLKLHRECGKEAWLKRFFSLLAECPEARPRSRRAGLRQSFHWYLCASMAAGRDLSAIFCDRWRLPLSAKAREAAAGVQWSRKGLKLSEVLAAVPAEWRP